MTRSERLGFMGYPVQKGSRSYGEDIAKELLEQAEFVRKRITLSSGGLEHRMAELRAEEWLKKQGEKSIFFNRRRWGTRKRQGKSMVIEEKFDVRPDRISERYIVECKTGTEGAWAREYATNQIRDYIDLASPNNENKTLVYLFWERPSPKNWWWELIKKLKANGVKVIDRYGDIIEYEGE